MLPRGAAPRAGRDLRAVPGAEDDAAPARRRSVRRPAAAAGDRARAGDEAAPAGAGRADRGHPAQHHQGYRPGDRAVAADAATWPSCWSSSISISPSELAQTIVVMDRGDIVLAGTAGGAGRGRMYDAASPSDAHRCCSVRSANCACARARARRADTVLDGSAPGGLPEGAVSAAGARAGSTSVTLNTSGGIAGGDRSSSAFAVGAGARATIRGAGGGTVLSRAARQSRRRVCARAIAVAPRRGGGVAAAGDHPVRSLRARPPAGDRAGRGCLVPRRGDAWCSAAPRWARRCSHGALRDADPGAPRRPPAAARCGAPGRRGGGDARNGRRSRGGARAMATLVHVAPDAGSALDAGPRRAGRCTGECGASAWDGMLMARILAADGGGLASGA